MVEDDDRDVAGDLLGAARGLLIAGQDFGEPDRRDPSRAAVAGMSVDSSLGSTKTTRITSFMVFGSGWNPWRVDSIGYMENFDLELAIQARSLFRRRLAGDQRFGQGSIWLPDEATLRRT